MPGGSFRQPGPLGSNSEPSSDAAFFMIGVGQAQGKPRNGRRRRRSASGRVPGPIQQQPNAPPPAFPRIPRVTFYQSLRDRLAAPHKINQAGESLCGPAAFIYLLAKHKPDLYIKFAIQLYESGEGWLGNRRFVTGQQCRNDNPTSGIDPVDWVTLGGLRDGQNLLPFGTVSRAASGITFPSELAGWLHAAGFGQVANKTRFTPNVARDPFEPYQLVGLMTDADSLHKSGHRVCMLIHGAAIQSLAKDLGLIAGSTSYPSHWVVLSTAVDFSGGNVRFKVFTWGMEDYAVPYGWNGNLPIGEWIRHFYGFVSCKP